MSGQGVNKITEQYDAMTNGAQEFASPINSENGPYVAVDVKQTKHGI